MKSHVYHLKNGHKQTNVALIFDQELNENHRIYLRMLLRDAVKSNSDGKLPDFQLKALAEKAMREFQCVYGIAGQVHHIISEGSFEL